MTGQHRDVLFRVADAHRCWIGVREPNELADRWIASGTCVPKPVACKAKTADDPAFPYGGLVVDPTTRSEGFLLLTRIRALRKWRAFTQWGLPAGYTVTPQGRERGLVRYMGRPIFADYDLMALVRSNDSGERLHTPDDQIRALFARVGPALNEGFGVPMIQHGPEFDPDYEGLGAGEREWVLWFGPGRRFERHESSMPADRPH